MVSGDTVKGDKLATYYERDDYYFSVDDPAVRAVGSGVKLFGFDRLKTDQRQAFQHLVAERKVKALDLTFGAPKSLAIAFAVGSQSWREKVVAAHRSACSAVMAYIENQGFFQAVKKENGSTNSYPATGMLVMPVHHSVNRNMDPLIHSHYLIGNAAVIPGEDQVRAVDYRVFYRNQRHFDVIYKSVLRAELEKSGISTRSTTDGFEINSVTRDQIEAFSSRLLQVNDNLSKKGLTRETATSAQRQEACLKGRRNKSQIYEIEQLQQVWQQTADEYNICLGAIDEPDNIDEQELAGARNKLIKEGLVEYLDRAVTFTRKDGVDAVLRYARTATDNPAAQTLTVTDVLSALPSLISALELIRLPGQQASLKNYLQEKLISAPLLRAEAENRQFLNQGQSTFPAAHSGVGKRLDEIASRIFSFEFNGEQKQAALGILTSQDFLTAVQGDPGTGKTTMLLAVAETFGRERMVGLSVSGDAASKLSNETGLRCATVARFLIDVGAYQRAIVEEDKAALKRLPQIAAIRPGDLIVVDEASMLGTIQANQLCHAAMTLGARIVLTGDRQQLPGVGAGQPFSMWQDAGMETFTLKQIRRQRNALELAAVEAVTKENDAARALSLLQTGNCVKEVAEHAQRLQHIVDDYLHQVHDHQSYPLLITGTNSIKNDLNSMIREQLVNHGVVSGGGTFLSVMNSKKQTTEKEFAPGDRILFLRNDNKAFSFVTTGDGLATTVARQIFNGTQAQILSINDDGLIEAQLMDDEGHGTDLTVQWNSSDYPYFDYSYAISSYKSQGKSVERMVMYHAPHDSPLLSKNEFLVGISRNKNQVRVYTDNAEKMLAKADAWVYRDDPLQVFMAGIQQDLGNSQWVNVLVAAVEKRQAREADIAQRKVAFKNHFGMFSRAPKVERDSVNNALKESRELFHADLTLCQRIQPAPADMSDLERTAARYLNTRNECTALQDRRFIDDTSRSRFTNHYRRQNKIDEHFSSKLAKLKSSKLLSKESYAMLTELEDIMDKKVYLPSVAENVPVGEESKITNYTPLHCQKKTINIGRLKSVMVERVLEEDGLAPS